MISARAWMVLIEAAVNHVDLSGYAMSKSFKEGRDAMEAALKELREVGYIELIKQQIKGKWVTNQSITSTGYRALETRCQISLAMQNSNNAVISNSLNSKPGTPNESVEEFMKVDINVGYEFFEKQSSMDKDEQLAERNKAEAKKKAEYVEFREKKRSEKRISRHEVAQELWTVTDVGYDFADRIHKYWHIKPWSVTNSKFIPALDTMRKKHDTNGRIEVLVMDQFFSSINFEKYDDAEAVWRLFISRFPNFVQRAKLSILPEEVSDKELAIQTKSRSWLED